MSACKSCCHWSQPFRYHRLAAGGFYVALYFQEWIAYHLHVLHHQRGAALRPGVNDLELVLAALADAPAPIAEVAA